MTEAIGLNRCAMVEKKGEKNGMFHGDLQEADEEDEKNHMVVNLTDEDTFANGLDEDEAVARNGQDATDEIDPEEDRISHL